jgi:hypothetical protein
MTCPVTRVVVLDLVLLISMLALSCNKDRAQQPTAQAPRGKPTLVQSSAKICADRSARAAEALGKGKKILAGVTVKASIAQSMLLASADVYDGKVVRIEGPIVGICQKMGCWAALQGPDGKDLNLKVVDGELDFRKLAAVGLYAVGEGKFMKVGPHGAQVQITGAMIGLTSCP